MSHTPTGLRPAAAVVAAGTIALVAAAVMSVGTTVDDEMGMRVGVEVGVTSRGGADDSTHPQEGPGGIRGG